MSPTASGAALYLLWVQRRKLRLVTAMCGLPPKPDSALAFMSNRPRQVTTPDLRGVRTSGAH